MTFKDIYSISIRFAGAVAGFLFLLEAVLGWPPTFGPLMIPVALLGLTAGRELAKEGYLDPWDKFLVLPPFVYSLNWLFSLSAGPGGHSAVAFVVFTLMVCTFIVILLDKTKKKDKEVKATELELGKYPIYLSEDHYITTDQIVEHVQVIGKSGSGKTKSYFKNAILQAMKQGLGMFIVDPKSEEIGDLTYYAKIAGRTKDYFCFDLLRPENSVRVNPLYKFEEDHTGKIVPASQEVSEVVFGALYFEEVMNQGDGSHYVKMAKTFLENVTILLHKVYPVLTFCDYYHLITAEVETFQTVERLCELYPDSLEADYFKGFWLNLSVKDRVNNLSGLVSKLSGFVKGPWATLINTREPDITMKQVIQERKIFHFGSAALAYHSSYKPITVAFLYDIMGEVGKVGSKEVRMDHPFHLFLDEFHNVAYPGFIDIINKVRSKGMPCHIGHQSMGDLNQKGKAFEDQVIDSTTTKICFRILNDETAQRFGNILGTKDAKILRTKSFRTNVGLFRTEQEAGTAEKGIGEKEYVFNPDEFKRLQKGEAIGMVTYKGGVSYFKMNFQEAPQAPTNHAYEDVAPKMNHHLKELERNVPFEGAVQFVEKKSKPKEEAESSQPMPQGSNLPGVLPEAGDAGLKLKDEESLIDTFLKAFSKMRNQARRKNKSKTQTDKKSKTAPSKPEQPAGVTTTIVEAPPTDNLKEPTGKEDGFLKEVERLRKKTADAKTLRKKPQAGPEP